MNSAKAEKRLDDFIEMHLFIQGIARHRGWKTRHHRLTAKDICPVHCTGIRCICECDYCELCADYDKASEVDEAREKACHRAWLLLRKQDTNI